MTVGPRVLSIQDFLLAYVLGEDEDAGGHLVLLDRARERTGRRRARSARNRADLRAEVERHQAQVTTVDSGAGDETVTRCVSCPTDEGWPCTALRVLALPYARHPAYRTEWQVPGPVSLVVPPQDGPSDQS